MAMVMAVVTWLVLAMILMTSVASTEPAMREPLQDQARVPAATTPQGTAHQHKFEEIGDRRRASIAAGHWTGNATTHLGTAVAATSRPTWRLDRGQGMARPAWTRQGVSDSEDTSDFTGRRHATTYLDKAADGDFEADWAAGLRTRRATTHLSTEMDGDVVAITLAQHSTGQIAGEARQTSAFEHPRTSAHGILQVIWGLGKANPAAR